MGGALDAGGRVVGVLADSLARSALAVDSRQALRDGRLVLVSAADPNARFTVGRAMDRNKYLYGLGDWAVVVNATEGKGGTWAGAVENLKRGWVPVFVRAGETAGSGNRALLEKGAKLVSADRASSAEDLRSWIEGLQERLDEEAASPPIVPATSLTQMSLLENAETEDMDTQRPPGLPALLKPATRPLPLVVRGQEILGGLPATFSNSDVVAASGLSQKRVTALLAVLKKQGLVGLEGRGAAAVWRKLEGADTDNQATPED